MKNIKLVAIDMDGTLLDDSLVLSERNRNMINELLKKGIHVVFATGRTFKAAQFYAKQLDKEIPLITYNGALVKMTISEEEILSNTIPMESAYKVIKLGQEHNIYMKIYIDDTLYVEKETPEAINFSKEHRINYRIAGELSKNIKKPPHMIVFKDSLNKITRLREKLKKDLNNRFCFTLSTPYSLEFSAQGISKANRLIYLANKLDIASQEILAIGNSLNDLDMLKLAGIGIAMKNSDDELKSQWDNISEYTNNDDGVAKIIEEKVLSN